MHDGMTRSKVEVKVTSPSKLEAWWNLLQILCYKFTAESAIKDFLVNKLISSEVMGNKVDCFKHHMRLLKDGELV